MFQNLNLKNSALILIPLTLFFTAPSTQASDTVSKQTIETFLAAIKNMQFPVTDTSSHARLVATANSFLDLDAMGKQALEAHWYKTTLDEQQKFLNLLWKLIEVIAYPKSHKFIGNFEITYPEVKPSGTGFDVHSVIKQEEKGLDAKVVYHLYAAGNQWKIDNIILDDVSLTEDLKYQFDKIIEQSGFEGLLKKMQEKFETAEKELLPKSE